jgi:hypothetical protein
MITKIEAYDVSCSDCERVYGAPSRDLLAAMGRADVLVQHEGWEREGDKLVCPSCARQRWYAKHSLVAAGCPAPR